MLPERPELEDLLHYSDEYANAKYEEQVAEYECDVFVARCMRIAATSGAKSREIDIVKYIGNTEEDALKINELKMRMIEARKKANISYGKTEAWKAQKDLYRTDSYNMVGGMPNGSFFGDKKDE
jgi:hypothetical protein